jgi:hypothetical protein
MTLKDRIENNLTIAALSLAITSFAAGVATDRWAKDVLGSAAQALECKAEAWQELAKKAEWAPLAQCPAFPLKFNISSPGNGVTLAFDTSWEKTLRIPFVVSVSRPLPDVGDIGFVVKPKDSSNFFTVFPLISRVHDSNTYRAGYGIDLPVNVVSGNEYEIRAVFIDKKMKFGDRFTGIAQVQNTDPSVVLSDPIIVRTDK